MSEAKTFNFELVSPEEKLISAPAWQVVVPAEEGHMGVRAGHTAVVASIKPGVVEIFTAEGEAPEKIFIAGGFADISAENLTLLAEEAVRVEELNAQTLETTITELGDDLSVADNEIDKKRIQARIEITQAQLNAVTD